jgi:hypothetical protein
LVEEKYVEKYSRNESLALRKVEKKAAPVGGGERKE